MKQKQQWEPRLDSGDREYTLTRAEYHAARSQHEFIPSGENPEECAVCGRREGVHKLTEKM